jgi:hypothetical protein
LKAEASREMADHDVNRNSVIKITSISLSSSRSRPP